MPKDAKKDVIYLERVTPAWFSFLPLLIIYPTLWLTWAPFSQMLGALLGIFLTLTAAGLMVFTSRVTKVTGGTLYVAKAQMPIEFVGAIEIVDPENAFSERGPKLDARAFLSIKSSLKGLVKIEITDPNDKTPYWLVSSRKPVDLKSALLTAKSKKS